ncbi:MAG: cyclic nucleotide-binding domain-containing protein [bacterium]|nr:cyclic nucleotide-binding domain-containing protein [bacterium]
MYSFQGLSEEAKSLVQLISLRSDLIFSELSPKREILVPSGRQLYQDIGSRDSVYRILDGHIKYAREGRSLLVCPEGSILGIEDVMTQSFAVYQSEFATQLAEYRLVDILQHISLTPELVTHWSCLLAARAALFSQVLHEHLPEVEELAAEFSSFEEGEKIIEEGVVISRVYTLLSGRADVYLKGVKVGEVNEDETFGAISALTSEQANATIIACNHCTTMHIEAENFIKLIKTRPASTMKLIRDMARIISSSNARIATNKP